MTPGLMAASFLTSLVVTMLLGPVVIPVLRRLKYGQTIRNEGPAMHQKKQGTPTMGGLMFMTGTVVAVLLAPLISGSGRALWDWELLLAVLMMLGVGLIGFADDYIKVVLKRSLGLRAREKLVAQVLLALVLGLFAYARGSLVHVPFTGWVFDLHAFYPAFVVLVVLSASNAVNLTDGLDGLCAGSSLLSFLAYAGVAYLLGHQSLVLFALALAGGALGFLRFNRHPAQVFMGDTGSMALGGALASVAVLTRTEVLLPIIGGLYVVETLSVIIQVLSFRLLGRRVFRMAPLHHHFELAGWPEEKVVRRFWLTAAVFSAIGIWALGGMGR